MGEVSLARICYLTEKWQWDFPCNKDWVWLLGEKAGGEIRHVWCWQNACLCLIHWRNCSGAIQPCENMTLVILPRSEKTEIYWVRAGPARKSCPESAWPCCWGSSHQGPTRAVAGPLLPFSMLACALLTRKKFQAFSSPPGSGHFNHFWVWKSHCSRKVHETSRRELDLL